MADVNVEVWQNYITEHLVPDDSFINMAVNEDDLVENKTVHRPQVGSASAVKKNRTTYPATATKRVDTIASYDIDEFTTDPVHIPDIEKVEVSYNKMASVMREDMKTLRLGVVNNVALTWFPKTAAAMIRTTGDTKTAEEAYGKDKKTQAVHRGATGSRVLPAIDDIINADSLMDDMDVPLDGRKILMPTYMYKHLISAHWKDLLKLQKEGSAVLGKKSITSLFNFQIIRRSTRNMPYYNNAALPVRQEAGGTLATSLGAMFCWHPEFVGRALSSPKMFYDDDNPLYYGDISSFLMRGGGSPIYKDETGIVAIIEKIATASS